MNSSVPGNSFRCLSWLLSVGCLFWLWLAGLAGAAEFSGNHPPTQQISDKQLEKDLLSKDEPIFVKSDTASYNNKKKLSIYQGNVVATKGTAEMKADRIEGVGDEAGQGFKTMTAFGSVVFDAGANQGCAGKVYYYGGSEVLPKEPEEEKPELGRRLRKLEKSLRKSLPLSADNFERLIMEDNPKMTKGDSLILGDWMRYFRLLEVLEVYGNVFVHYRPAPQAEQKKKTLKKLAESAQSIRKKPDSGKGMKKESSTFIFADNAIFYQAVHQVFFYGKIEVYREGMILTSPQITVYLDQAMEKVERIVAEPKVDVWWEERHLTAGKAVFHESEQKLVMTDHPVAVQGRNRMIGDEMVYDLVKDVVTVTRAFSTFHPHDFEKDKKKGGIKTEPMKKRGD